MQVFDFDSYVGERARRIQVRIGSALKAGDRPLPDSLARALASGTQGGKRLRPVLALAAAEAVGSKEEPLGAAAAVELVHCYSLIHDDLPSMDDAAQRRGEPTLHVAFGEATAVLAGDALLTLAFEVLAEEGIQRDRSSSYLEAARELARAAGPRGMVGGQVVDMEQKDAPPRTLRALELCHAGKTAALFSAAAAVGALSAGGSKEAVDSLRAYGFDIGLAFQHADDLVDGEHSGLANEARSRAVELCDRAQRAAGRFGHPGRPLVGLAEKILRSVALGPAA